MPNFTINYFNGSTYEEYYPVSAYLNTTSTIRTNLSSTSAVNYTGKSNVTPGVIGILPVSNGGTGQTTLQSFANDLSPYLSSSDSKNKGLGIDTAMWKGTGTGYVFTVNLTFGNVFLACSWWMLFGGPQSAPIFAWSPRSISGSAHYTSIYYYGFADKTTHWATEQAGVNGIEVTSSKVTVSTSMFNSNNVIYNLLAFGI